MYGCTTDDSVFEVRRFLIVLLVVRTVIFVCSCLLILQHATTFSHSHLLNTHCNRFFNVYNSHLACRTSSSLPLRPTSESNCVISKSVQVASSSHIYTIIKLPQLLLLLLVLQCYMDDTYRCLLLFFYSIYVALCIAAFTTVHNRIAIHRLNFANSL